MTATETTPGMICKASHAPVQAWTEDDGHLLRLRLNRPKANVLDAAMMAALNEALQQGAETPALRGVILDATGPHFSFGASVTEHLPESVHGMLTGFHALVLRLLAFPVPVLSVIRGSCLGGGLEVVCATHLLFATPDAQLGQPEISLGVFAPAASCLLPERLSRGDAEDLLLSGRSITGEEAHRIGLVNAVAEDPQQAACAWYDAHLAPHSAAALRYAVAAARTSLVERVRSSLAQVEQQYLTGLMQTDDAVEGLTAFLAKRPAQWKDH